MPDIIVEDIPEEHYRLICEDAAKLGISADDYLTQLVKDYARELITKQQAKAKRLAKDADDGIEGLSV
jgi:negative regulator of replication initiation